MLDSISSQFNDEAIAKNSRRLGEIAELRSILEPEIAALAARNIDDKGLARLKAILDDQERPQGGGDDAAEDLRFHMALARTTKNEVLREVVAVLYDFLRECRVAPLQSPERKRLSLQGHRKLLEALEARDPELSRAAMRGHLGDVEAHLLGKEADGAG